MTTEEKEKNIDDFLEMLATPDEFGIPIDPEVLFQDCETVDEKYQAVLAERAHVRGFFMGLLSRFNNGPTELKSQVLGWFRAEFLPVDNPADDIFVGCSTTEEEWDMMMRFFSILEDIANENGQTGIWQTGIPG